MTIFVQNHQQLYWTGILLLTVMCCAGWYYFGATRPVPATIGAHPRPSIGWQFRPAMHQVMLQIMNVVLVAQLRSDRRTIGVALHIKVV